MGVLAESQSNRSAYRSVVDAEKIALTSVNARHYMDHPSGFLALSKNNARFTSNACPGFVAYRDYGRHRISLAGVHAPKEAQADLFGAFLEDTQSCGLKPLMVQLPEHQVPLCLDHHMTVNQLGATFALSLAGYSFAGTAKMKLRNKIKRARRAGVKALEVGADTPWTETLADQLQAVSRRWLAAKKKKELQFMVGEFGAPEPEGRRIFAAVDESGVPVGFVSYVPVWGRRSGYLHDLSRRLPHCPVGVMELCNAFAIERMMDEGIEYLHFGFTPFVADGEEPPGASRVVAWVVRQLHDHGQSVYPAKSQVHYKVKWGCDIVKPEYIAAKPLSFRAVYDLLRLTRSF